MKKLITLWVLVFGIMMLGVVIGRYSIERDIVKVYEDGSFVGCYSGAQCND